MPRTNNVYVYIVIVFLGIKMYIVKKTIYLKA